MIQTQVYPTEAQMQQLKILSSITRVSVSRYIREGLDAILHKYAHKTEPPEGIKWLIHSDEHVYFRAKDLVDVLYATRPEAIQFAEMLRSLAFNSIQETEKEDA